MHVMFNESQFDEKIIKNTLPFANVYFLLNFLFVLEYLKILKRKKQESEGGELKLKEDGNRQWKAGQPGVIFLFLITCPT